MRPYCVDFIDKVGNAFNAVLANRVLHHTVIGNRNALLVDLHETALPDQALNSLFAWLTIRYVRFDQSQHANGSFIETHKGSIVQLSKSKELHHLLGLGGDSDGTSNTNHKDKLGLSRNIEASFQLGLASVIDSGLYFGLVVSIVLGGVRCELGKVCNGLGFGFLFGSGLGFRQLGLGGLLLEYGFGSLHRVDQ